MMTKKQKAEKALIAVERLKEQYPEALCSLEYQNNPWRLLVMGRLSAQCTDAKVNIVCRELFDKYATPADLAYAPVEEIEKIIRPCGLFRMKARDIKEESRMLIEDFDGVLPDSMEELLKFSGVGRKIANLLLGDIFKKPAIVTDTHCIRICGRLGMYKESEKNPKKVEDILVTLIPPSEQSDFCHRLVLFGREFCKSQSPACRTCPLADICTSSVKGKE